jgi:hypothetical protein
MHDAELLLTDNAPGLRAALRFPRVTPTAPTRRLESHAEVRESVH